MYILYIDRLYTRRQNYIHLSVFYRKMWFMTKVEFSTMFWGPPVIKIQKYLATFWGEYPLQELPAKQASVTVRDARISHTFPASDY